MKKSILFWFLAFLLTLFSAVFQRITGPTYPLKGKVKIENKIIKYTLERSHSGKEDHKVSIKTENDEITGIVFYKRYKTDDKWQRIDMKYENGLLIAKLPYQPPAGKLEYKVVLIKDTTEIFIPEEGSVIIRFKGDVPSSILIPHILFMFLAMLFSTRAGLEYFNKEKKFKSLVILTLLSLFVGGFILGPLMQYFAFGEWWNGYPLGFDLTDNKTLIAFLFWIFALYKIVKSIKADKWVLIASIVTFVVYLIPHSLLGSELDYSKFNKQQIQLEQTKKKFMINFIY